MVGGRIAAACAGALAGVILAIGLGELPGLAGSRPSASLVSDTDGALREICIHYCPEFHEQCIETYADLLSTIGAKVVVRVVVEDQRHYDMLMTALARLRLPRLPRLRPVVTGFAVTPWAKDRFGTMVSGSHAVAAVPPTTDMVPGPRANDCRVPYLLSEEVPGMECRGLPFYFDGGDLLADRKRIFVAANFLARNQPYDTDQREELLRLISNTFGREVVVLGDSASDVPDHHIGMYLTLLGDRTVAVADPDMGYRMWQEIPSSERHVVVETDFAKYEPFRYVIRIMEAKGYNVIRMPMLLTDAPGVYVTYNNAVVEDTGSAGKHIYMPVYGVPSMDGLARRLYESAGLTVIPVRVGKIYEHRGSLRCLVGIIRRTEGAG